jgi:hypothetical protein
MEMLFNAASKYILIKDMSNVLDFDLINKEFDTLAYRDNIINKVRNVNNE